MQEEDKRRAYIAKEERFDQELREYQRTVLGEDYVGACLSKFQLPELYATDAIQRINAYVKNPVGFLVFLGTPGTGKTYLCSCLIEWAKRLFGSFRYHHEKELLSKLRKGISMGEGDYMDNLEYFIDDEVVFLDDVGADIDCKKTADDAKYLKFLNEVFLGFLNYRIKLGKPTVITSNLSQADFKRFYSPRHESRLFAAKNTIIEIFDESADKRKEIR